MLSREDKLQGFESGSGRIRMFLPDPDQDFEKRVDRDPGFSWVWIRIRIRNLTWRSTDSIFYVFHNHKKSTMSIAPSLPILVLGHCTLRSPLITNVRNLIRIYERDFILKGRVHHFFYFWYVVSPNDLYNDLWSKYFFNPQVKNMEAQNARKGYI